MVFRFSLFLLLQIMLCQITFPQQYAVSSVLNTGNWYKLSVEKEGVYKIDLAFLNKLGVNTSGLSSASVRLFGNGGKMLPENNLVPINDDLQEVSLQIFDGGDGQLNGTDYCLFYATGPDEWIKDSTNQNFRHVKNIYADQSYFYLSIGGTGKRIASNPVIAAANTNVNTFNYRYYHENDTLNFLKSGKEWYGEEFSNTPGNTTSRTFTEVLPGSIAGPVTLKTSFAARCVGADSHLDVKANNQILTSLNIPPVSGNFLEPFAKERENSSTVVLPATSSLNVAYTFLPGSFNAQGWLNWFEVHTRSTLQYSNGQLTFRDWSSAGAGKIAAFTIASAPSDLSVWDVTHPSLPVQLMGSQAGGAFSFINDATFLREYIAFSSTSLLVPNAIGLIPNQNLHQLARADMLIVTSPVLRTQAQRLAAYHQQTNGLQVTIVTTVQVFNEFASGSPDPTAIRNWVRMYYDRAGVDISKRPKYLLLFGDASFDYKSRIRNNTNLVPAYESTNSLEPLNTYTSDDYFGYLDATDDINNTASPPLLDIAIGRIPAATPEQATIIVNKIIAYSSPASFGPWRNQSTYVADDEDGNLHLNDVEEIAATAQGADSIITQNKIYLDAFRQVSGSGGSRYPSVNQEIVNQINAGNLIWNYSGHGGSQRLAEEAILDRDVINQFTNKNKLPLFVTATCDFAPYDDPTTSSLGEELLLASDKGAIALTTTTRLVFASSNKIIHKNFLAALLTKQANATFSTLGDAVKNAKNNTNSSVDVINNRKFTLLGDPALTLAFPHQKINITTINGRPVTMIDTIQALNKYTIEGAVTDQLNNLLPTFDGDLWLNLYGPAQLVQTLANDAGSQVATFAQQNNPLYKGRVSVVNGRFTSTFIVPKDINYQVGKGKINLYAASKETDASGQLADVRVGGSGGELNDKEGPVINPFLNDLKFVNGGLTNEKPVLILQLDDSSGINAAGTGIGHDLTAILDGDEKNILVLNDFYEPALDTYQKGSVRFQLPDLADGPHTLKIKAWDVVNNSTETILEFITAKQQDLQLSHVFNYPNPFTTRTNFWFEHNQASGNLHVLISIYSLSGKLVHQIQRIISTSGFRSNEIEWDGRDAYSEKLGRGVYIYRISVTAPNGKRIDKTEKLYLL